MIKVLLIAEAANPEWVSVPLIGWSLTKALASRTEAHIVTQIRNREAFLRAGMIEGTHFTALDNEALARPVFRLALFLRGGSGASWTTGTALAALSYYSFEAALWARFGNRIKNREFDLVHRVTPLSPTHQSLIARKVAGTGTPFVLGPLNGGLPWPPGFNDRRRQEHEWLSYLRSMYKLLPGYKSTRQHASAILCGSRNTMSDMPGWCRERCFLIPENGIDPERFHEIRTSRSSLPLRVAFVGRLVPYKGADILLRAAATLLKSKQIEVHLFGNGPQLPFLQRLTVEYGTGDGVHFHGWVDHRDLQCKLRECDLLALPSVREFGGGVILEAMALGLPAIVADYGGPSELVGESSGFKVAFRDARSLVAGFEEALRRCVEQPQLVTMAGRAARDRVVRFFTWQEKARQIEKIYMWVLGRSPKPESLPAFTDLQSATQGRLTDA